MVDLIRIASTIAIVAVHLVDDGYWAAIAGVMALYWLSGYLAKPDGSWQWWLSRYCRIWPAYAAVFAVSSSAFALGFWSPIYFAANPTTPIWLAQLVLIVEPGALRVVPIGWMLSAQLFAFGLVAAIRTDRAAAVLVVAGATVLIVVRGWHYQSLPVAVLFTVLGYAMRGQWGKGWRIPGSHLCYPTLLTHYPAAALIANAYGMDKGWPLFFASLPLTLALSWLLWRFVEVPLLKRSPRLKS